MRYPDAIVSVAPGLGVVWGTGPMVSLSILPIALGAAVMWALSTVLAQAPARALGAFKFTRIQLITSALLLAGCVTVVQGWSTVVWERWPAIVSSGGLVCS